MCNLHIPSICLQGEGYLPKPHIIDELKERFKKIIVFFDNDFKSDLNYGHIDALKICRMYNLDMVETQTLYLCTVHALCIFQEELTLVQDSII